MPFSGQMWYITEGGDADTRLVRINDDGTSSTTIVDNGASGTGDDKFSGSLTSDIGVDTAAGFYFALLSSSNNDHAVLVRGGIGSSAAPTEVVTFGTSLIVNTIEVDAFTHKIYVGVQDGTGANGAISGIKVYSYDTAGALTDLGFITTANSDNRADAGGFKLLDPQDFAIDHSVVTGGRMFYSERLGGASIGLFRLDLNSPDLATSMIAGGAFPADSSNGQIIDVEVDETNHKVYFTTRSLTPSGGGNYDANDNAIWWIDASANGGSPTKVTLSGMPANVYYGGDMTFDQSTRQIYVESEESSGSDTDDVIYVLQLNAAGTTATWIRTISPSPVFSQSGSNIEGMAFTDLPALTVSGTSTAATEQGGAVTAVIGAPTITDSDSGYLVSATVQITGGTFSSNENSTADDHLGYGAGKQITGTIAGTNITVSWNASTETLTLTGYDTIAHYQTALAGLTYWATGDNPTNYGANTSRTITWTVSDGSQGVLPGSVNTTTSTINIAAVNDAPVNGTVSSATGTEGGPIAVTGLQIHDPDANPASSVITVTLTVTKGVLNLLTNVSNGLTSGDIVGNGGASVTLTGTLNEINATLAASSGLVFTGNSGVSGTDTLTVVTSDGGAAGSGGTLTDTDNYTITIIGVNDAPVVAGDGTETLAATNEDAANAALTNTVSSLFSGQYSDGDSDAMAGVAVIANGSSAGTGQWQYYNGSAWVNIGAASTASAVTIAANTPIRFLSANDYNGPAPTLTVKLVDASGGALTNGAVVNVTTSGGTTHYSTGSVVLDHAVTAVNDAPTVTGGAAVSLTSIGEDSAPGAGQAISSLFASHFVDTKDQVSGGSTSNAFAGVAVTGNAATAAQGVYQYFEGGSWHDLPAVSNGSAFVLDAATLVRFVPAADYSGTAPALTVSLIDDSSGAVTTGATANLTTVGGSTPYSAALTLNVVVTPTDDPHTGGASITGTPAEHQVLTAVSTLADPDGVGTLHYQWQHDLHDGAGFVDVGTDQSTYTLGAGDIGGEIQVIIRYTDGGGTPEAATSAPSATVAPSNDAPTGGVSITGTVTEDQVLSADTSTLADVDGLGTLHYQWQHDLNDGAGFVNVGTDQSTYTLGDGDVDGKIQVVVSYTDGQGFTNIVTSAATANVTNVNDAPSGGVSIAGTTSENHTLTADTVALVDLDGLGTLHYQWQRDSGSGFVDVGTDQATYDLTSADIGGVFQVVTSYTDGHGASEAVTSTPTDIITIDNGPPVAVADIIGLLQRLSVSGSVQANDTDPGGDTLTVTTIAYNATHVDQAVVVGGAVVNGAHGVLTINPDGTYSYVANVEGLVVGQVVTDKFDYTIQDPSGMSATAQLTVTVTGSADGDANANTIVSDGLGHTLTGRGGADTLTGNGGADIFAYEAVGDSTVAAYDTITDFAHGADTLRLTPLMTASTKLTLATDGTDKILYIDQNGDGVADGQIKSLGQGLQVSDIVTGVADFGFTITGSAGADTLRGGSGGDLLTGGAGADTFVYGVGDSSLSHWDIITDFATGQDKLDLSAADGGTVAIARLGASNFVYFGSGEVVQVNGDLKFDDLIVSGAVHGFTLYAGPGDNVVTGSAGADVLVGGSGNSTLIGGGGADILYGGAGNDTFRYTAISHSNFAAYDVIFGFDYGHDKIDVSAIDGGKVTIARFAGSTFVYSAPDGGGNFQVVTVVTGTQLQSADVIASGGAAQAFVMVGDSANHNVADTLVTGAGNDILYGLDGADSLTGGAGADFMLGGAGADTFVYTAAADSLPFATDLIFDFSHTDGDKIDLTAIDANTSGGGNDAFSVVSAFSHAAGQLVIAAPDASGYYHLSGDVNGDGVADFVIAVNTTGTFTSADILL